MADVVFHHPAFPDHQVTVPGGQSDAWAAAGWVAEQAPIEAVEAADGLVAGDDE